MAETPIYQDSETNHKKGCAGIFASLDRLRRLVYSEAEDVPIESSLANAKNILFGIYSALEDWYPRVQKYNVGDTLLTNFDIPPSVPLKAISPFDSMVSISIDKGGSHFVVGEDFELYESETERREGKIISEARVTTMAENASGSQQPQFTITYTRIDNEYRDPLERHVSIERQITSSAHPRQIQIFLLDSGKYVVLYTNNDSSLIGVKVEKNGTAKIIDAGIFLGSR